MRKAVLPILLLFFGCKPNQEISHAKLLPNEKALISEISKYDLEILYNNSSHFNGKNLFVQIPANGQMLGEFICPENLDDSLKVRAILSVPHTYLSVSDTLYAKFRNYATLVCKLNKKFGAYRIYTELGSKNSAIFTFSENRRLLQYKEKEPNAELDIKMDRVKLGDNWQLLLYH